MTFFSYAQNLEDVMLWRALKHVDKGFYIDVGANDPVKDSVTKAFYEKGWRGINIEPVSDWFEKISKDRPNDINLELAVGEKEEKINFYKIANTGLSTADKSIAQRHKIEQGYDYSEICVLVKTLSSICEACNVTQIHFLKIDVEGMELAVLRGFDLKKYRPWIILIESTLPNTQIENFNTCEALFFSADYSFAYFDGLNRFYVAIEHSELISAFKYPPNVFDDYKIAKHEAIVNELEKEVLHFQTQFQAISTSQCWAITKPLRVTIEGRRYFFKSLKNITNFKFSNRTSQVARKIFICTFQMMHKFPFVVKLIAKIFSFFPSLKLKLRNLYFNNTIYSSREKIDPLKNIEVNDLSEHAKNIYKQFIALESDKLGILK